MWSLLSIDEKYCHSGFGCDTHTPCKSHLCWLHRICDILDGRAIEFAHAGSVGDCCGRSSGCVSVEIPLGLLVVVPHLHLGWGAGVLLHSTAVFLLEYG